MIGGNEHDEKRAARETAVFAFKDRLDFKSTDELTSLDIGGFGQEKNV